MSAIALRATPFAPMDGRGVGTDAGEIWRQGWRSIWAYEAPISHAFARIADVLEEIETYRSLDANWDLDGADAVDQNAARLAATLVRLVATASTQQGVPWDRPEVGPLADGGFSLVWEGDHRRALIVIHPDEPYRIECVVRGAEGASRGLVSLPDAVEHALWALSDG